MSSKSFLRSVYYLELTLLLLSLAGCGGGGGVASPNSNPATSVTPSAATFFTKNAVGNTWSFNISTWTTIYTETISASSSSNASFTTNTGATWVRSLSNGSLIDTYPAGAPVVKTQLPASFSVGTTWTVAPDYSYVNANYTTVDVTQDIATVVATNVTRTVPAGTFSDCVQTTRTEKIYQYGNQVDNATGLRAFQDVTETVYWSPYAGNYVEWTTTKVTPSLGTAASIGGVMPSTTSIKTGQLRAGYIAF